MSLLGQQDDVKVFRCPECGEFTASNVDNCKKCGVKIDPNFKSNALHEQDTENKAHHIKLHKAMIQTGIVVAAIGAALLIETIMAVLYGGRFFLWAPIVLPVGLGQIIYGILGIRRERRGS